LYFVPGDEPTRDQLREIGFDHAEFAELPGCGCKSGPNGEQGYVFGLRKGPHAAAQQLSPSYYVDKQVWRETHGGKMWLGWDKDRPPTPEDLQRDAALKTGPPGDSQNVAAGFGRAVRLNDCHDWIMPAVGVAIEHTRLPVVYGGDKNGALVAIAVEEPFGRLWAFVQRFFQATVPTWDQEKFTPDDIVDLITLGLALNYRISRWEVLALGFLSPQAMQRALCALEDLPEPGETSNV
jgi:hypothetical protein